MAATKEQVFEQVRDVLVDALGVDEEEVKGSATLMGDLGAESIDFLDIVFRLEKAFGIKVPREELFPVETLMNNPRTGQQRQINRQRTCGIEKQNASH